MSNTELAYAKDVKQMILETPKAFVSKDDVTAVWFEKEIVSTHGRGDDTIADCLVFSVEQGLIGIEIKSARDSKKRLRRQLRDYSKVCDYVWVVIHDSMLPEVNDILEDYPHVGIMCYSEIALDSGKTWLATGVVSQPSPSPAFNLRTALDMLWSDELYELAKRMAKQRGVAIMPKYKLSRKQARIDFIMRMGEQYAHDSFMALIASGYKSPERRFATYDFQW